MARNSENLGLGKIAAEEQVRGDTNQKTGTAGEKAK